jgi:hypothetical protein
MVPDLQVKPGVPTDHIGWASQYIVDLLAGHPATSIIQIGDAYDMPSLSSYDKGKGAMEGRRYKADIDAGNAAFKLLDGPISRQRSWDPRKVYLYGNHEHRILRAINDNAQLGGTISLDDCNTLDWERHPFLRPVVIDGVAYCHYFYNPMTGRAQGGMIETRLKTLGFSFTMGHQQTLMYGVRPVAGKMQHGLVAGCFYAHDEEYLGPQGNDPWRGIIVKHEVQDGSYCPMFVSMDYLARRYGGFKGGLNEYRRATGVRA